MGKYFKNNSSAHRVSDMGQLRERGYAPEQVIARKEAFNNTPVGQWQTAYNNWIADTNKFVDSARSRFALKGDANDSGSVDIRDATTIQKHVAGMGRANTAADVDGNGAVNIKDATTIQKSLVGMGELVPNYRGDSSDYLTSSQNTRAILEAERDRLKDELKNNYSQWGISDEQYKNIVASLDGVNPVYQNIVDLADSDNKFMSQWSDETAYKAYTPYLQEAMLIDKVKNGLSNAPSAGDPDENGEVKNQNVKPASDNVGDFVDFNNNRAIQKAFELGSHWLDLTSDVRGSYSEYFGENLGYDEQRAVAYKIGLALQKHGFGTPEAVSEAYMKDGLIDFFESDEFADAVRYYENIIDLKDAEDKIQELKGHTIKEWATLAGSGIASGIVGIGQYFNFSDDEDAFAPQTYEIISQGVMEDLADVGFKLPEWLGGYSIGQTVGSMLQSGGQMLPSIGIGMIPGVGQVAGPVSFGLSAGGNAKAEMMREGYDLATATAYGTLVGAAEAVLEKLVGSIPVLGKGKTITKLTENLTKGIKDGVLRAAANLGIDMVKEFSEESAQEVLSPLFKLILTQEPENVDWPTIGEWVYAGMQGALMAGTMNAPGTAVNVAMSLPDTAINLGDNIAMRLTKFEGSPEKVGELLEIGLQSDMDGEFYKFSSKLNKKLGTEIEKAKESGMDAAQAFDAGVGKLSQSEVKKLFKLKLENESNIAKEADSTSGKVNAKQETEVSSVGSRLPDIDKSASKAVRADIKRVTSQNTSADFDMSTASVSEKKPNGFAVSLAEGKGNVGIVGVDTSLKGDKVTYITSDGKRLTADEMKLDGSFYNNTIEFIESQEYSPEVAAAVLKASVIYGETSGISHKISALGAAFDALYSASAESGTTLEAAGNDIRLIQAIHSIGADAAQVAVNAGLKEYRGAVSAKKGVSIARNAMNKVSPGVKKILKRMSDIGNMRIVVENFADGDSARGYYENGVVHLNAKKLTSDYCAVVAIHEAVHHIKAQNEAGYNVLEKYVREYLKLEGKDVDALVSEITANRKAHGEELTPEGAMEELVADTLSGIASDKTAMEAFLGLSEKEKSTLRRVLESLAERIKTFADTLTGAESRILVENSDNLLALAKELNKAMKTAGENAKTQKNTAQGGVRYSAQYESVEENTQLIKLIAAVKSGVFKADDKVYFGKVSSDVAKKIQAVTGIDVSDYVVAIEARQIEHIIKDHGSEGKADKSLSNDADIAKMEYVLNEPDGLSKGGKTQAYTYMRYGRNRTADTVLYEKVIGKNSYYVVQAIPETKAKTLFIVTAFIGKSGYKKGTPQLINAKSPDATPEVGSVEVPNNIISEDYKKSNSFASEGRKNSYSDVDAEITKSAEEHFGVTYSWKETGYILTNGKKLDFSGKHNGAPGGYRTVDHREILEAYDESAQDEMSGAEAMVDFMQKGNIRVSPETDGINVSVLPTKAQETALRDFISRVRGEIILDIDNRYGDTEVSVEYPRGTSSAKILQDIRQYFEDGTEPTVSEISKFRYSFGDEEVDLWGLIEPEEAELSEASERMQGFIETASVILDNTREVELKEGDVRRIVNSVLRKYTNRFNTEYAQRIELILDVAQKNPNYPAEDIVGEIAAVMKEALAQSDFRVDPYQDIREEVNATMKHYSRVYLTRDQLESLESSDRSVRWLRQKLLGRVTVVNKGKYSEREMSSFEDMYRELAAEFPEFFKEVDSSEMPDALLKGLEDLRPQVLSSDNFLMQSDDVSAVQLASEVLTKVVDKKYSTTKNADIKRLREQLKEDKDEWLAKWQATGHLKNIEKNANSLIKWIEKPTKKQSVPENLATPILELLEAFDFTTGRVSTRKSPAATMTQHDRNWWDKMDKVAGILRDIGTQQNTNAFEVDGVNWSLFDIKSEFVFEMEEFAKENRGKRLVDFSATDIAHFDGILLRLRNTVTSANRMHQNMLFAEASELAENSIEEFSKAKESKYRDTGSAVSGFEKTMSTLDREFRFSTADAFTFSKMLGKAGESVMQELWEGYEKFIENTDAIKQWAEEHIDVKKVKKWRKDVREITLASGETITITVPQIMELYALAKRKQAQGHLYGYGVVVERNLSEQKKIKTPYQLITSDVATICSVLTKEQLAVADAMQKYLTEDMAALGNEVTMKRYLYKAYVSKNYWPIQVFGDMNKTTDSTINQFSLYAVGNPGFSKQTQEGANNAIVIHDIFTSFSKHCGQMAMLNGMSIPLSDALKWYNYTNGNSSLKGAMKDALSKHSNDWFIKFLADLNNQQEKGSKDTKAMEWLIRQSKAAAIWGNMRVVLQQFSAYARAWDVLDMKYLLKVSNLKLISGSKKALKYCPVAKWKNWGFFTTDIGNSLENIILPIDSVYDKVKSAGFFLAGKADEATWGALWNACEKQVRKENPDIKVGSEEFNKLTAKVLTKVVNDTQVVDSPFHRSQIRRNTDVYSKLVSSFMDEPIKSFNMLRNAIATKNPKKIGRAVGSFVITAILCASLESLWDLLRSSDEDDEDKNIVEKYLGIVVENTLDNVNPFKLIPLVNKIWSIGEGWLSGGLDENGINTLVNSFKHLIKRFTDEDYNRTLYADIYEAAKAISYISGIGVHTVMRDIVGATNIFLPDGMKITTTGYTKTALAEYAVDALLKGDKELYEEFYEDLLKKSGGTGHEADVERKLYAALSKTEEARLANDARRIGDKATYDRIVNELLDKGFSLDVVIKGTNSLESQYNNQIAKIYEAQVDGDEKTADKYMRELYDKGFTEEEVEASLIEYGENYEENEPVPELLYDTAWLVTMLEQDNVQGYGEIYQYLIDNGKTDSSIKSAITRNYKSQYANAWLEGDSGELEHIREKLEITGLYDDISDTFTEWLVSELKNMYLSSDEPAERAEIRTKLWKTGKWDNLSDMDERLAAWREADKK